MYHGTMIWFDLIDASVEIRHYQIPTRRSSKTTSTAAGILIATQSSGIPLFINSLTFINS